MMLSLPIEFLTILTLSSLLALTLAQGKFPCHNKAIMADGVTCTKMALPNNLCTACPLRSSTPNGHFRNCRDIYNTHAPTCLPAMQEYVKANPCDAKRSSAVVALTRNSSDTEARIVVDFFLYAMCEQCCDCVPMGANKALYHEYLADHSATDPKLYSARRGNCPAHAVHDICKIAPRITRFTTIGDDDEDADIMYLPPACPMLRSWLYSEEGRGWQQKANTEIEPQLETFMLNMLQHLRCGKKDIWDKCYDLENAQKHLGEPEDYPTESPEISASPESNLLEVPDSSSISYYVKRILELTRAWLENL